MKNKNGDIRILLTYGWCRTAYVAAVSLSRAGYQVYACDSSRLAMARYSRYVSGFDLVPDPFKDSTDYVSAIAGIARARRINLILPCHEDGISIQRLRSILPADVVVAFPPPEEAERVSDKLEIVKIAATAGVPVPKTIGIGSLGELEPAATSLGFPLCLKTRHGNSSKGVVLVNRKESLFERFQELVSRNKLTPDRLPLLQQYLPGGVHGVCFLACNGIVQACFVEKYIRCKDGSVGTSVLREKIDIPMLEEYARRIAATLRWTGVAQLDFILNDDLTSAHMIEMNPRLWGALNLSYVNGYDFPKALVEQYLSSKPPCGPFRVSGRAKWVRSLWIVGEIIATLNEVRQCRWWAPAESCWRILRNAVNGSFDDFRWTDPLPFVAECLWYAKSFVKSGFSTNPDIPEMMR